MTTSSDIIKLDVECVPVILPGWINRDVDHKKADVHLDVTRGLPYADNQDLYILSEHFIEHIPSSRLATLFSESHRISALGGIVRVPIPNLGDIMDAYIKQDFGLCSKLWKITSACRIPTEALCNWGYQFLLNRSKSIRVLNN